MSFTGVSIVGQGQATGHAINVDAASGSHLLVINGYSHTKATAAAGAVILSLPFMVGGHRWRIFYCPKGAPSGCAEDSVSLILSIVNKNVTEDLKVQVGFSFLDQHEKQDSAYIRAKEPCNFSSGNRCWVHKNFVKRDALEKSKHLNDDCFTIRCDLAVVPPPTIQELISNLLMSKEGTDVTFNVGGETFVAHRSVLVARSSVFKAKLFGPIKEDMIASVIQIEDMEAKVFRALLSFIYTDLLPEMEVDMVEEREAQEVLWLQHLIAAADRYNLQRLKVLCEDKLCKLVDVSSVRTIFILAERHNCGGLKDVCLEFLKTPSNLKEITATNVFDDIIRTCPYLLEELIGKLAS
ncbi:hypothetical protein CFC21_037141 [Triticum aestivum]|uniref:BTB domain-containing protein n=2 Tax=Triticum aestivum TaxID=4565 RepID=A0A3B6EP90_WHEAT|nr:BTB/POZ and MATH domain-containing protein 1-like [Triticum aestivum]KAF7024866.1 hypothetical protein CFC21_037141 [Triticum aestivum]